MGSNRAILAGLAGLLGVAALLAGHLASAQPQTARAAQPAPSLASGSLTAFASEEELRQFLQRLRRRQDRGSSAVTVGAPPPPPAAMAAEGMVAVTGSRIASPSITNTQEADVDEGGIVKVRGQILVILRRGRLFTISLARGGMRPVDSIDAFPPGVSGRGDWYDEMLLSGDRVIVVGYSYARGGTEINRFRIDPAGRLTFEDAYHLKSNDYYSSRNYASRLIGNRLIFYTPLYLGWSSDPLEVLPGIRKWEPGARDRRFRPIARPNQIYVAPAMRGDGNAIQALHSVVSCDLVAAELDCSATGVLGPASRTFYVSSGAVYLWVADFWSRRRGSDGDAAFLFRLPFGRERPSAIAAEGAPVDQFSFREDRAEGVINVLLRKQGGGDAMGGPEATGGGVALLRLPIADLGDGSQAAAPSRYRRLPNLPGQSWSFQNRFVGNHVLYGGGAFGEGGKARLVVAPVRGGPVAELDLAHAVGRIEALGSDALVVGSGARNDLGFTAVELSRRAGVRLGDVFTLPAASEGETRSHAFFFRPTTSDGASGILGLPIARPVEPAYRRFFGSAASMLFLRRDARRFAPAGELDARVRGVVDDACQASCVDWYGNARPIFLGPRIFALLGYELVEGRMARGAIREIGRTNFAPRARRDRRD